MKSFFILCFLVGFFYSESQARVFLNPEIFRFAAKIQYKNSKLQETIKKIDDQTVEEMQRGKY